MLPRLGLGPFRETLSFCRDALEDLFQRRADPFDRYGSAWPGWRTGASARSGGGRAGYDTVPAQRDEEEAILGEDSDDDDDAEELQTPQAARPPPQVARGPQPAGPSPWNDQASVPQRTQQPGAPPAARPPPPPGMDSSGTIKL
jgi:hypothetical protein